MQDAYNLWQPSYTCALALGQIFVSHSRSDVAIRNFFDSIFAGSTVKAVRVEFEDYTVTPSRFIKEQMFLSDALFVLLGPSIGLSQYTENWVAFEVGLAAASEAKAIWVFEPFGSNVRFPVPYLHHYVLYDVNDENSRRCVKSIVKEYEKWPIFRSFPLGVMDVTCPYTNCQAVFRLHSRVEKFDCPTCRKPIEFKESPQSSTYMKTFD